MSAPRLQPLVIQAWELRGTGYLVDACAAIVDAYQREPLTRLEAELERQAQLVRVLRATSGCLRGSA